MNKHQKKAKHRRYAERTAVKLVEREQLNLKRKKEKLDLMITYTYDLMIKHLVQPLVRKHFGFGPVRMQRFTEKVTEWEVNEGMSRGPTPIYLTHEWAKKQRLANDAMPMIFDYAFARARDVLSYMGYGETRLKRMFDANVPAVPGWYELYDKGGLHHDSSENSAQKTG